MNIIQEMNRYLGVRLQCAFSRKKPGDCVPMLFLGGMNRTGNHLLHSLLDGHPMIKAVPEEDWFLSRNISSLVSQLSLFWNSALGNVNGTVDLMLKQNEGDFWNGKAGKVGPGYKVDFEILDYGRFRAGLERLAAERRISLRDIYSGYIDRVLESIPSDARHKAKPAWRMYFVASSDYLIRPMMSWDPRNKAIVSLRDPLQRFGSIKKWSNRSFICDEVQLENWWKVHNSYKLFRDRYKERILFVDYDDMVTDTAKAMSRVTDFLGINYHDILSRPTLLGRSVGSNTSFSDGSRTSGVIHRDSLTKYKKLLTGEEVGILKRRLRPLYLEITGKEG